MRTKYRVIDSATGETLANGLDEQQAWETAELLRIEYPDASIEIERYVQHTLGRDPDLD